LGNNMSKEKPLNAELRPEGPVSSVRVKPTGGRKGTRGYEKNRSVWLGGYVFGQQKLTRKKVEKTDRNW